jgi:hypothetical protein
LSEWVGVDVMGAYLSASAQTTGFLSPVRMPCMG